jgi:hypothetical protein
MDMIIIIHGKKSDNESREYNGLCPIDAVPGRDWRTDILDERAGICAG